MRSIPGVNGISRYWTRKAEASRHKEERIARQKTLVEEREEDAYRHTRVMAELQRLQSEKELKHADAGLRMKYAETLALIVPGLSLPIAIGVLYNLKNIPVVDTLLGLLTRGLNSYTESVENKKRHLANITADAVARTGASGVNMAQAVAGQAKQGFRAFANPLSADSDPLIGGIGKDSK